jgi:hypothetical protein
VAEPGPVVENGPPVDPRWVGSGWTLFNNKGKPVRQFEPFFSQIAKGHQFEFGAQVGNDTVTVDPKSDEDVGGFFELLPQPDYFPTWLAHKMAGSTQDQDAPAKASKHAKTPTLAYLDSLGRTFLTVADNGDDGKYTSRGELDIQGNQRSVSDTPLGGLNNPTRTVMRYEYDMIGSRIHQACMEAGERWMLNDVMGKTIGSWDSRGHNFRTLHDPLRRPTELYVQGTDPNNSDPRTMLQIPVLYEKIVYGEGQPNDRDLNLRTRLFRHFDTVGVVTNMALNPATAAPTTSRTRKGRCHYLNRSRVRVADRTRNAPDWHE